MGKITKNIVSIFMIIILCFSLIPFDITVRAAGNEESVSSSVKKSNEVIQAQSENKQARANNYNENAKILLIQDNLPWDENTNTKILDQIGESYNLVSTSEFMDINLWDYDVVIFANDQTFTTYSNYSDFREYLELFTEMGGVIVFGAGDFGWSDGSLTSELPGGVSKIKNYCYRNYVSKSNHPIVTGELTNDGTLTDDDLYENYCSHGSFVESSLPMGYQVILRANNDDAPTLVEYPIGNGLVIASTLTWEYNYVHGGESHPEGGYRGKFAEIAMKDMFLYAISKSRESLENKYTVKVKAIDSSGVEVPVSDAYVTLFDNSNGQAREVYSVKTNSMGEAKISVAGFNVNQLKNATISAYKDISRISGIDGDDRNPLFDQFGTENGHPVRLIYQLHSEKLDTNGNWCGIKLPKSNDKEISLVLTEPRLLANLSVAYMDDSNDAHYQQKVKDTMNYASMLMAQATDGHVFINKVILQPVYNRYDFFDTSKWESMADIQIQTKIKDDGTWWNNIQIHSNANVNGFYFDDTFQIDKSFMNKFSHLKDDDSYIGRSSYYRVQLSGKEGAGWNNNLGTKAYATTVVHELGHYLLGFFDEYLDANGNSRRVHPNGERFGLMDNQHDDIEISRANSDYAYLNGNYGDSNRITMQVAENGMPCETFLSEVLKYEDRLNSIISSLKATYSINTHAEDRTAGYSYSALSEDDFIIAGNNESRNVKGERADIGDDVQVLTGSNNIFYTSYSQNVIAYLNGEHELTATFIPQDQSYSFENNYSVNEPTVISVESSGDVNGEIYSQVSVQASIDFTTLSWYKLVDNEWIKVVSRINQDDETKDYGVLCDYCGDGLYVVMAEVAKEDSLMPIVIQMVENNNKKDASVFFKIENPNNIDDLSCIELCYSEEFFDDVNTENHCSKIFNADEDSFYVQFEKTNTKYYVYVVAYAKDGSASVSECKQIITGEADSDGDGIPDWYCDKYSLWGLEGENKDIANSDENENGMTNLDEYMSGNDPTLSSESYVSFKEKSIKINRGESCIPEIYFALGRKISYSSSDSSIATVADDGTVKAINEGQAIITAMLVDDFGEAILDLEGNIVSDCLNVIVVKGNDTGDINDKLIAKKIRLSKTSYTYNGKIRKPTVTVIDYKGKKISSTYYSVSYSNNKKVGKATVTVKLKNGYSGILKKNFSIIPKATKLTSLTGKSKSILIKWKKQKTQTTGYQLQYSMNKKFSKKATMTKTIKRNTATKMTVKKLKAKKTYYVRVRTYKIVNGKKYYSAWSKVKKVKTKK